MQTSHPRPNIVMVLMDDASYELLATMPQALRMQADGATYENTHVVDSLCCPSRASIFTGRAPHQTGVLTNTPNDPRDPIGGYAAYTAHDNAPRAFNVALQRGGYTTGFIGKYLNGYEKRSRQGGDQARRRTCLAGTRSMPSLVVATTGGTSGAPAGTTPAPMRS